MHEADVAGGILAPPDMLAWLAVVSFTAGVAKGLTGFGAALVMAPLFGLLLPVSQVPVLIVLVHCVTSLQDVSQWARIVQWRTVAPFALLAVLGAALSMPLIAHADAPLLRHGVAVAVLATTVLHINGWRWNHDGGWWPTCVAGAASGLLTAIGGLGGPPAVYYFSGLPHRHEPEDVRERMRAETLRANLLANFAVVFTGVSVALGVDRQIGLPQLYSTTLLAPIFAFGAWAGGRASRRLPARWFDGLVSGLLLGSGLLALFS